MRRRGGETMASHKSKTTTDHEEIRRWAEARGATPARVAGTGGRGGPGMIRLDFPGYSGAESLEPISWDEWFQAFDDNNLALVYQETTASGEPSNFNKLVGRETAVARSRGVSHASRHRGTAAGRSGTTGRKTSRGTSRSATGRSTSSRSRASAGPGRSARGGRGGAGGGSRSSARASSGRKSSRKASRSKRSSS